MAQGESGESPRAPGVRGLLAREWPFLVVCAGVCVGLGVVVGLDRFRRGTLLVAASVILGAWLRALLPAPRCGLLKVRGRAFDVATMLVLGVSLVVVALAVPPPS
jgi:Protein of unknown function (DUF3017)